MIKISAVVTTHNRKYEVRRALDSIYAQTELPDEIILVDDHSTDGTREYIGLFEYKNLIYVELNDDNGPVGPGAARNVGIKSAHYEYVSFLDSDNEWDSDKLKAVKKELSNNTSVDILYSKYSFLEEFSRKIKPYDLGKDYNINLNDKSVLQNCFDASATVFRKSILERINGYNEDYMTNIDWEIAIRLYNICKNLKIGYIDKLLSNNNTMHDSLSENIKLEIEEKARLICQYKGLIKDVSKKYPGYFYKCFMKDINVLMDKKEAIWKLIKKVNDDEFVKDILSTQIDEEEKLSYELGRKNSFYSLLFRWLDNKIKGKGVVDNLINECINSVAIYGAGKHGKLLAHELIDSDIEVCCFIDKNIISNIEICTDKQCATINVYSSESDLPEVDAVIVTPYLEIDAIRLSLEQKGVKKVISLYDIV